MESQRKKLLALHTLPAQAGGKKTNTLKKASVKKRLI
jgi:hypothetical protein